LPDAAPAGQVQEQKLLRLVNENLINRAATFIRLASWLSSAASTSSLTSLLASVYRTQYPGFSGQSSPRYQQVRFAGPESPIKHSGRPGLIGRKWPANQ
jgi:hypothetical protein